MLKKLSKLLIVLVAVALSLTAFVACNGGGIHDPIDDEYWLEVDCLSDVDTSGWTVRNRPQLSGELRITYFDGGFGGDWISAMARRFEEEYDVTVTLIPRRTGFHDLMLGELRGLQGQTTSDIYIAQNISWQSFAGQGHIANLDGLFASTVYTDSNSPNSPVTFRDRIARATIRTSRMRGRDGNVSHWQVPFVMGVGGLAYDAALFEQHNWEVPETTEDLYNLLRRISSAPLTPARPGGTVAPITWSGSSQYLWDSVVFDWWAQLAGIGREDHAEVAQPTSIMNFNRYETSAQFNPEYWPELKAAWTEWYNLIAIRPAHSDAGFSARDHFAAQQRFIQGHAAMIPAASFLVSELARTPLLAANPEVNIRMMPTPIIAGAREDADGNPIRTSSMLEYNQNIIVAQRAPNKEAAKEFLRFMTERDISLLFPEHTHGALLAHRYDLEELHYNARSDWERSIYEIMKTSLRFSTWSDHPIYTMTSAGVWPDAHAYDQAASRPNTTTPDAVFDRRWNTARNNWNRWLRDAGLR